MVNIEIDCTNVTFILAGAFSGLFDDDSFSVNFNQQNKKEEKQNLGIVELTDRLINYGMTPELAGRTSNVLLLKSLTVEDFVYILKNYSNSAIQKCKNLYNLYKAPPITVVRKCPIWKDLAILGDE